MSTDYYYNIKYLRSSFGFGVGGIAMSSLGAMHFAQAKYRFVLTKNMDLKFGVDAMFGKARIANIGVIISPIFGLYARF